jgi:putative membrane protein
VTDGSFYESWPSKADPFAAAALAVSAALYAVGLWRRSRRLAARASAATWEAAAFAAGWILLALALLSPLATASDVLFSLHMTQHELLMLVCAPLLMLGRPLVPMIEALPARLRRKAAVALAAAMATRLTAPLTVFLIHAVVLWVWHVPVLFEAAVLDDRVHLLQHILFVASACLFWWGMLRGRYGRLGYGVAVFYVFATAVHSGGLGALITLSPTPWYGLYRDRAGHGHDALADQQLAGLIMWVPSGVVMTMFALAILAAWLGESERRRRRGWTPAYGGSVEEFK